MQTLLALQEQYRAWRDALPESLAGSATAELLEQVCDLDLSELEAVELPRGFGRDRLETTVRAPKLAHQGPDLLAPTGRREVELNSRLGTLEMAGFAVSTNGRF